MNEQLRDEAKELWSTLHGIRINAILDGETDEKCSRLRALSQMAWNRFQRRNGTHVSAYGDFWYKGKLIPGRP